MTKQQAEAIYALLWVILILMVAGFVITFGVLIDIYQHLPGYPWPNE